MSHPITATFPCDVTFSSDPDVELKERVEFMQRAENAIVETGMLGIDHMNPNDVETIDRCFDLEAVDTNDQGLVLPTEDDHVANRLPAAGLLDQSRDELTARWGML